MGERRTTGREAVGGGLAFAFLAGGFACGCAAGPFMVPQTCAPHDATCQTRMAALNDPTCKNGSASNAKCLDPSAPP